MHSRRRRISSSRCTRVSRTRCSKCPHCGHFIRVRCYSKKRPLSRCKTRCTNQVNCALVKPRYRQLSAIALFMSWSSFAQMVEVQEDKAQAPKEKAADYFKARQAEKEAAPPPASSSSELAPRFLALHIGTFFSDQAYSWGEY